MSFRGVWFDKDNFRVSTDARRHFPWRKPSGITNIPQLPFGHQCTQIGVCNGKYNPKTKGESGIFATKYLKTGDKVMVCPGEYMSVSEYKATGQKFLSYSVKFEPANAPEFVVRAGRGKYLFTLINSGYRLKKKSIFNTEFVVEYVHGFPLLWVEVISDIKPKQELLIKYGRDYWSEPKHRKFLK